LLVGGVGQHPKVTAATSVTGRALASRGQETGRRRLDRRTVVLGTRVVESVDRAAAQRPTSRPSRTASASAIRSSSSGLVASGPECRTSSQPRGAVIRPAWLTQRSQECGSWAMARRADDRRRIPVHEGSASPPAVMRTARPATATRNAHDPEIIVRKTPTRRRTRAFAQAGMPNRYHRRVSDFAQLPARPALGGQKGLAPRPRYARSAAAADGARVAQVAPNASTWRCSRPTSPSSGDGRNDCRGSTWRSTRSRGFRRKTPTNVQWPPEVVADGPIALARLISAGGRRARQRHPRTSCVVPQAQSSDAPKTRSSWAELLHEILVAQVATYLDVEPSVIDPTIDDE